VCERPPGFGAHIRPAGLDFRAGEVGLRAPRVLTPRDIGLAAAMNVPWLSVRRRPRVAVLATGDELVRPGEPAGPHQIISSNGPAIAALVRSAGAEAIDLGIAPDRADALAEIAAGARGADLLVTLGGASVGEHDLIHRVLGAAGASIDFWRIAMRPGKPLMFGRSGDVPLLGLPGNPVSALVCGLIFLLPALRALLGLPALADGYEPARLGRALPANDQRQDYLRATLERGAEGGWLATPFPVQDSSMLSRLADADCLIVRPPRAPAAEAGAWVDVVRLAGTGL
jgi:molybdopterin molybdotransferase